jgi:hypothetical protein
VRQIAVVGLLCGYARSGDAAPKPATTSAATTAPARVDLRSDLKKSALQSYVGQQITVVGVYHDAGKVGPYISGGSKSGGAVVYLLDKADQLKSADEGREVEATGVLRYQPRSPAYDPRQPEPATQPVQENFHFDDCTIRSSVASDWPYSARAAAYPSTAPAGFDAPEGLTRLLEQRWSLADIASFCIPARRHNPMFQNLVVDSPEAWKGRLYPDQQTGFDKICWYATVRDGRVLEYSLGVYRGDDFWLLEIGDPQTVRTPPQVTPDPSHMRFMHK